MDTDYWDAAFAAARAWRRTRQAAFVFFALSAVTTPATSAGTVINMITSAGLFSMTSTLGGRGLHPHPPGGGDHDIRPPADTRLISNP